MKLIVMGTGPFAVPSFRALIFSGHNVAGLVTRPDKLARGRKRARPNPMRDAAREAGITVFAPDSINSAAGRELLDQQAADLLVVCDYGEILPRDVLGRSKLGGINLHGSLLPKYRGAAPINWALLNGDTVTGVTVIHMTPRLDGGPILTRRSLEIGPHEDAVRLEHRLSLLGVDPVLEAIELLTGWDGVSVIGEPQVKELATKAPRLKKSDGEVDWTRSGEQICNQVRALKPWPGTFTTLSRSGKEPLRVILQSAWPYFGETHGPPGKAQLDKGAIIACCGDGGLRIERLQPAGKREMDSEEFARGYGATLQFGSA